MFILFDADRHRKGVHYQGGVTPIDSIVTAATAVGQWSTVKATQTGAVNGQSGSKVQSKMRAALFMATCRQVLQGQIADRSKVNRRKSAWSTVKTPKTAVKALTHGRSCDYSVYGSDPPLIMSLELRSSLSQTTTCYVYARRIPRPHPQTKPEWLATNA